MVFDCPCGRKGIATERALSYHIHFQHSADKTYSTFQCPLSDDCKSHSKFSGANNILRHFRNNHDFDQRFDFLTAYAGAIPLNPEQPAGQEHAINNQQPVSNQQLAPVQQPVDLQISSDFDDYGLDENGFDSDSEEDAYDGSTCPRLFRQPKPNCD